MTVMSVLISLYPESGITPGLWITCSARCSTWSAHHRTPHEKESGSVGTRPLTVRSPCNPVASLTAWLMVRMYSAAAAEYTWGASSKKIPCIASFVEFDAHPAYVDTSAMTSAMSLVAYPVRMYPIVIMLEHALSCSTCAVYCWSGYGDGPGPLAGFTTTTKRSSG